MIVPTLVCGRCRTTMRRARRASLVFTCSRCMNRVEILSPRYDERAEASSAPAP